jgi:hypothetical protein
MPTDPTSDPGLTLTRTTIWLALVCYTLAEVLRPPRWTRHGFNSAPVLLRLGALLHFSGALAYLAHVACAFHFQHQWSHAQALIDTARQTAAVTGWNWGGGLWVNYAFSLVWITHSTALLFQRPLSSSMEWGVRIVFFFMIFNGAVIFARPSVRLAGVAFCVLLAVAWWPARPGRPLAPPDGLS